MRSLRSATTRNRSAWSANGSRARASRTRRRAVPRRRTRPSPTAISSSTTRAQAFLFLPEGPGLVGLGLEPSILGGGQGELPSMSSSAAQLGETAGLLL